VDGVHTMPALTRTLWRHARIATLAPAQGWGWLDDGAVLTEGPQIHLGRPDGNGAAGRARRWTPSTIWAAPCSRRA
jgi:hypothetical protein